MESAPCQGLEWRNPRAGRIGRKVPESDARSQIPSTGLRHPSFNARSVVRIVGRGRSYYPLNTSSPYTSDVDLNSVSALYKMLPVVELSREMQYN